MNNKNINTSSEELNRKTRNIFLILGSFFIANAILAEFIGIKMISLDKLFGQTNTQFSFLGLPINGLNIGVGVVLWPFVFIISDIINEYFGKSGVKKISFITAGLIAYAFVIVLIAIYLPPADFWLEINSLDQNGNPVNINNAYAMIFGQGLGIIVGSIFAFLVGQWIDAYVFQWFKSITQHKYLWLRATGSTVVSQLIDSILVLFIAFYIFGKWSLGQVFAVGMMQYFLKIFLAIIFTPLIYLIHYLIDKYLGLDVAKAKQNEQENYTN